MTTQSATQGHRRIVEVAPQGVHGAQIVACVDAVAVELHRLAEMAQRLGVRTFGKSHTAHHCPTARIVGCLLYGTLRPGMCIGMVAGGTLAQGHGGHRRAHGTQFDSRGGDGSGAVPPFHCRQRLCTERIAVGGMTICQHLCRLAVQFTTHQQLSQRQCRRSIVGESLPKILFGAVVETYFQCVTTFFDKVL